MSKTYVPQALRQKVAEQARHRCGYCLTAQRLSGMLLTIEHLLPEARGGKTEEDNLWLACVDCNDYKGDRIEAVDPVTGEVVKLFDPRHRACYRGSTEAQPPLFGAGPPGLGKSG